jgi:hypothetical protein
MVYTVLMANSAKPSASVIAAAVVAILAGLFTGLVTALGAIRILLDTSSSVSRELPPFVKGLTLAMMAFMTCLSLFGLATGIGLILLRNWARISVLTWGASCVFFGLVGAAAALFISLPPEPDVPNLPAGTTQAVRLIALVVYALPAAVGAWWLVLFTRRGVKAQFVSKTSAVGLVDLSLPQPQKPRCPLAILVIAWYFISAAANVVFLPFLPFRFPTVYFGHAFQGWIGTALLLLNCSLLVVAGVGLLKLKPWSYPLTIALQLIHIASGIMTLLSPNFDSFLSSVISKVNDVMHLPPGIYSPIDVVHNYRWFAYFGLLIPLVIVVLLFYYRERFLEAASAAKS